SSDTLCEGDGHRAVRRALAEGRVLDFFKMVNRLLNTYAEGRAYVELDRWEGIPCHDCGSVAGDDSYLTCGRCEETVCFDCSILCSACEQSYCDGCASFCQRCTEPTCNSCLDRCRVCGNRV